MGHAGADTRSPREALEWIRRGDPFDVAILDMQMPEMDGVMLARRSRSQNPTLPLMLFSSSGRREIGPDSSIFAAQITKPLKPSQLFDALMIVLAEQPITVRKSDAAIQGQLDPDMGRRLPLRVLLAEDNAVNQKVGSCVCWNGWVIGPTWPPTVWKPTRRCSGNLTTWC